jgi:hypothetical protein
VFGTHYIVMAHIGGGLLLAAGLMTRISTLFQLPVLGGAIYLASRSEDGLFARNLDLYFTAPATSPSSTTYAAADRTVCTAATGVICYHSAGFLTIAVV